MRRRNQAISAADIEALQQSLEGNSDYSDWQKYQCKLVTPLYGGGVEPGKVDQEMPIRASAIRGQLRFWWRVACGPFSSSEDMFARETAIWGGIGKKAPTASKVEIRVREVRSLSTEAAHIYPKDRDDTQKMRSYPNVAIWADGYAVFSAQGKLTQDKREFEKNDSPRKFAREGAKFQLHLRLSGKLTEEQKAEVEIALRWWASFGGLGSRTRRGLGAVRVEDPDTKKELKPVTVRDVEDKNGILKLLPAVTHNNAAITVWKNSVARLKDFRQGKAIARNPPASGSQSPAGRSLWPEADTLRKLSGIALPAHKVPLGAVGVFPRAAFGLPIVFHFKDAGDPGDHILEPANISPQEKRDRMASPLILRPYWNGAQWQPVALLLPGWEKALEQPLKFKGYAYAPAHWPMAPTARAAFVSAIRPMNGLGANDPLSAFMQFF